MFVKMFLPAFLSVLLLAGACKEPEPFDPGDDNSDPTKGTIIFRAYENGNDPLEGVLIGVTPNHADRDNGVFIRTGQTDANGRLKFEALEPLTYFFNAAASANGQTQNEKGSDSLSAGEELTINVYF